jgi:phosphoribosylglycinamide formyltransferase-1
MESPPAQRSIAVLISGSGTTLRNLIENRAAGNLRAGIAVVVSSHGEARGLEFARAAGIESRVVDFRSVREPDFSRRIFDLCRQAGVDLVVLGGFLRKLTLPPDFENRVINIHPSLIPEFCGRGFYGLKVHAAVLAAGRSVSGCTVHYVDDQFDHGPIIAQSQVPVLPNDTPATLAARVFAAECKLYPDVINQLFNTKE